MFFATVAVLNAICFHGFWQAPTTRHYCVMSITFALEFPGPYRVLNARIFSAISDFSRLSFGRAKWRHIKER